MDVLKKDAAKLSNGHGGVGATSHVSCLLFTALVGARSPMVAYRGSGPALNDLITGQYDFLCDQIPHTIGPVEAGSVRILAVAQNERASVLPNVPTTVEAGLPKFQASGWNAMFAPKGTPKAMVDKLADAASKALDDPATHCQAAVQTRDWRSRSGIKRADPRSRGSSSRKLPFGSALAAIDNETLDHLLSVVDDTQA
jgi:tripartite-type tricarboxylate transporter receptor subunit TctC